MWKVVLVEELYPSSQGSAAAIAAETSIVEVLAHCGNTAIHDRGITTSALLCNSIQVARFASQSFGIWQTEEYLLEQRLLTDRAAGARLMIVIIGKTHVGSKDLLVALSAYQCIRVVAAACVIV